MRTMKNIVVVPYDTGWPEAYLFEAEQIAQVFGEELVSIEHVGSTSVPGLCAKPVIDLMPVIKTIENIERFIPQMADLGYEYLGEYGIPGRRFFIKGGDLQRTHNIHIYEPGHPEIAAHLDFRDYLRAHPEDARRYCQIKMELARQFPQDITSYIAGKEPFIQETLRKARAWRLRQAEA